MRTGIAILGLNGCGKSTLAHALAQATDWYEMDAEDSYFPQQRASRLWSLEHESPFPESSGGALPFSKAQSKAEAQSAILADLAAHPRFILTGVTVNWGEAVAAHIGMAFLLTAPTETRVQRLLQREHRRFGDRVLPGGDMCTQQEDFRRTAALRNPQDAADSAAALGCPVYTLDGTLPVPENVRAVMERIKTL